MHCSRLCKNLSLLFALLAACLWSAAPAQAQAARWQQIATCSFQSSGCDVWLDPPAGQKTTIEYVVSTCRTTYGGNANVIDIIQINPTFNGQGGWLSIATGSGSANVMSQLSESAQVTLYSNSTLWIEVFRQSGATTAGNAGATPLTCTILASGYSDTNP